MKPWLAPFVRVVAIAPVVIAGVALGGCGSSDEAGFDAGAVVPSRPSDASTAFDATAHSESDAAIEGDASAWTILFDGTVRPEWTMSTIRNQPGRDDPGHFELVDGTLEARPGTDIGLYWYKSPAPPNFVLELEWKQSAADDNSGVFLRFPDLDTKGYDNTAFVAADFGFEVQIDGTGHPDGAREHTTGAIYNQPQQAFSLAPALPVGMWNRYEIRVEESIYVVRLNGVQTTRFENANPDRGASTPSFVGIQTHSGRVAFRNIRIRPL